MSRGDIVPESRFRLNAQPSEIRRDPILDRYTIFCPERVGRPLSPEGGAMGCPFCIGNEEETLPALEVVGDVAAWQLRVVPNLYPALRLHPPASGGRKPSVSVGMSETEGLRPPLASSTSGVHEVVIECPHHESSLANLPVEHLAELVHLWRRRILAHREIPGLEYAMLFKNQGTRAGASLEHSHSQVLSLDRVPTRVQEEILAGERHFAEHHSCIFCDYLQRERNEKVRIIEESDQFVTLCAYAGRMPFETWILPKTHRSHFEDTTEFERIELAKQLHKLLGTLHSRLCDPPFNLLLHNAPLQAPKWDHYHWHFEILPRLSQPAGFEWGTDWAVNLVPPEGAAEFLR